MKNKPSREAVLADVFLVLLPAIVLVPALLMGLVFVPVAASAFAISDQPGGPAFLLALLSVVILGIYGLIAILLSVRLHWKGEKQVSMGLRIGLWSGLISGVLSGMMLFSGLSKASETSNNSILLAIATLLIVPMFFIYLYRFQLGGKA